MLLMSLSYGSTREYLIFKAVDNVTKILSIMVLIYMSLPLMRLNIISHDNLLIIGYLVNYLSGSLQLFAGS